MKNLLEYLKEQGAIKAQIVKGPNGAFISATKADESKFTLPVGKRSQEGRLADMSVIITPEGVAIATANMYEVAEEVTL